MPSPYAKVADELEQVISGSKARQMRALAAAIRDLEARITTGLGAQEAWDASNLAQLTNMVEGALRDSGLNDLADEFRAAGLEMARTVDRGIAAVTFNQGEANMLTSAVNARMVGWEETVAKGPINWIREMLIQNTLSATPSREMAAMLLDRFDVLEEYAQTYIDTALYQQARDTWAVAGQSMGAEVYRYSGPPLIDTSHEFCVAHYEEEKPLAEWEKLSNGTDLPVVWSCGGWNCRHYLEPVPP
jgi:hypothetical protein